MSFSVLMSVYLKESPSYLAQCFESLRSQTRGAAEIVLVEDGPLSNGLLAVIEEYSKLLPLKSVKLARNMGLAGALNEGLKYCTYELIVRMDTDDVALPTRFERQVGFMEDNVDVDVASSWIEEWDQNFKKAIFLKITPEFHDEIFKFSLRRNPINHPAAIFRKEKVLSVGGYPLIFPEDYALWSLMLTKGFRFANIPEVLLRMRTGDEFMARRGFKFFKGEIGLLKYQKSIGFLSSRLFLENLVTRAILRLPPPMVRRLFYKFSR